MLTGPIFSPEDEDAMMDFDAEGHGAGDSDPRAREGRRGTVILEGEGEDEGGSGGGSGDRRVDAAATAPAGEDVYHTPPNVVPHDYHYSEEYEFSFDFTAPTHVYSLQLSPHNEAPPAAPGTVTAAPRKHPWLLWASAGVVAALCGAQQLAHVKGDLAALRRQNEQLRLTIEALQQEQMDADGRRAAAERPYRQVVLEDCLPAAAVATEEAKKHLFHHLADLKETFWMTAEQVRDFIEEELLGPVPQEPEEPDLRESSVLQWFNKTGVKETIDKAVRQVTSPKVWAPLIFMSGASFFVHWIGREDRGNDSPANDYIIL